jgi:hypothetical protein
MRTILSRLIPTWPYEGLNARAPAALKTDPEIVDLRHRVVEDLQTSSWPSLEQQQYVEAVGAVIVELVGKEKKVGPIDEALIVERHLRDALFPLAIGRQLHHRHEHTPEPVVGIGDLDDFAFNTAGYRYSGWGPYTEFDPPSDNPEAPLLVAKFGLVRELKATRTIICPEVLLALDAPGQMPALAQI